MKETGLISSLILLLISSSLYSSESSYFPMSISNKWEYKAENFSITEEIITTMEINGITYFGFSKYNNEPGYWLREFDNSVYYFNLSDSTEFLLFDFSIGVGDSIKLPTGFECSFGVSIKLVGQNDTVITPTGTYYNCYHFVHKQNCNDAGIMDSWFAKGIGKVMYKEEFIYGMLKFSLNDYAIITSMDSDAKSRMLINNLEQNYPNPFNPVSNINYQIESNCHVNLTVYDLLGREVIVLVNEQKQAGNYEARFNGSNMASGIYLYKLLAGQYQSTRKMLLIR